MTNLVDQRRVRVEEINRAKDALDTQRLADVRAVLATEEGRRLLHWVVYEQGGLQMLLEPDPQGRRALASDVYALLDEAKPGSPEELALAARRQRMIDDADIKSAIENRRSEYE